MAVGKNFSSLMQIVGANREMRGARPILADFVIGAHAASNGCRLLTVDDRLYRSSFPTLAVETF